MKNYQYRSKTILTLLLVLAGFFHAKTYALESGALANERIGVTAIDLEIADENLQQFAVKLTKSEMMVHVSKNLNEWHYPVKLAAPDFSHTLMVSFGKIANQETPVGISFSRGSSDPRSPDFQKTDVLPITCKFTKKANPASSAERQTTFSANQFIDETKPAVILEKLASNISTVCLSLLEEQNLPLVADKSETKTFKPTWIPDVQVEVKEVQTPSESTGEGKPETEVNSADETKNSIKVEKKTEGRKQLIIHNQGSPLILEFGHERR